MYDTIVVGAGSAGCVLAEALSADPDHKVLLLEAGGPDSKPEIRIPFAMLQLLESEIDWAYRTEPQAHLNDRSIFWPRGKVLGGSSSINAMVYIRGHRAVYDGWQEQGNAGWGYDDVLPYFVAAERNVRSTDSFHGDSGPLHVSEPRDPNPLSCAFLDAAAERGYAANGDFNGASQEGFGFFQLTMHEGERWSAASAFLLPALSRPNLTVKTHAHVTRIIIEQGRGVGVEYLQNGRLKLARTDGEVVLCGGAINSPQILLLSGIGPADELSELGLETVVDLPGVGANLQDHLDVPIAYACTEPISLAQSSAVSELLYRHFRKGPWSCNGGEAGAFLRSEADLPMPDLQFHFAPGWSVGFGVTRPQGHGFTFWPALLLPRSRGRLGLCSADPLAPPWIDPNYLAEAADWAPLLLGIEIARELAATRAFAPFCGEEILPGTEIRSEAQLRAFIRQYASTVFHPVGTCSMGTGEDAVVDSRLRVRGIDGLRVADASVMPTVPNGNTNAPAMMIGARVAEWIRDG